MKNIFKKLTCFSLAFLVLGCAGTSKASESSIDETSSSEESTSMPSSIPSSGSSASTSSSSETKPYVESIPEIRFKSNVASEIDFATKATKSDLTRPEVEGKFTITNCDESFQKTDVVGTMKVRGNQTANWSKKAFRIKFGSKVNLLGLNGGKKFKKWILLADAKDTTLVRTALGLYVAKGLVDDGDNVWVSDYTPVNVYLNDQYWGFYYLAEQKETKEGRVNLPEPAEGYTGTDIGYCFELDSYAASSESDVATEQRKGSDGDPTFRMKHLPSHEQGSPSGPLAPTARGLNTYTMLSDITDSTAKAGEHTEAEYNGDQKVSNSNQLSFIRDRMEKLYQVLYYASKNQAKDINEAGELVNSTQSVKDALGKHFNLNSWVDGYILNAYTVAPDLGYSSFYMSFDNTPTGDHKLRFDVPWDFDSNFGNRNNFYVNADGDTYVEKTYNTWLYLLSKINFFIDMVKVKWNKIRDEKLFEGMFTMMNEHFEKHDGEIKRNHQKWPQNDAAHQPPNNFDEIREPYKDPAQYKEAEAETISWCAKRVNFLEKKWGKNRPNISTK